MFNRLKKSLLGSFAKDKSGNVMILSGFFIVVLAMLGGAAVDYSQAVTVRARLSAALDAAALAVGAAEINDPKKAQELAQNIFDANFPSEELGITGVVNVNLGDNTVNLSANATVETALLGVIGKDTIQVGSETEVTRSNQKVEIVLVLDNTGSMKGSKIKALRTAASALLDIMFGDSASSDNVKISLVPFSTTVNLGSDAHLNGWIDTSGASSINATSFEPGVSVWQLYQDMAASNVQWEGCVVSRAEPFDTSDTAPTPGNPETLWVPFLSPDEPDSGEPGVPFFYANSYFDDVVGGSADERQRSTDKYDDGLPVTRFGPNYQCIDQPIQPLTNTKSILQDAIDDMDAENTTNIPNGLAWGWRAISPGAPFTEGAAYGEENTKKVIILLTDGRNQWVGQNNHNKSRFSSYGYIGDELLGSYASYVQGERRMDEKTSEICQNIKDEDITLYTITFKVNTNSLRDLMESCASDEAKYFDSPSNQSLINIFGQIAKELKLLRISK